MEHIVESGKEMGVRPEGHVTVLMFGGSETVGKMQNVRSDMNDNWATTTRSVQSNM